MQQFDDLKKQSAKILFSNSDGESLELELTRREVYEYLEIMFGRLERSYPSGLEFDVRWDRAKYNRGDIGKATVRVRNSGSEGNILRVLGRSTSRWPWLDGKMYYFGDLKPDEEKVRERLFAFPRDAAPGVYYLRIGFSEHSGVKPQFSTSVTLR